MVRTRDEALESAREEHDVENQTLEANLDLMLDRLRQSATPEVTGMID